MKWKLDRIISVATLVTSVAALVLVLKKPAPVAPAQSPAAAAANVESVEKKLEQLDQPKEPGQAPAQVRFNSDEITAALAQAAAALPKSMTASAAMAAPGAAAQTGPPTSVPASADAVIGEGEPQVKDYKVNFDGDVARGQFVTQIGGKDVYVTLAGHLGSKDGYATFDPTEFKVGDLSIPVSMVSSALQQKLSEQRDRLKLPDDVGNIKVENGQLVATQK
jgi:hypothetical protein